MRNSTLLLEETQLIEVYKNNNGSIFQSDADNCVYLNFSGKTAKYKFACLQRLKKLIDNVDLVRMTDVDHPGIEIIFLCGAEDCFVLDIKEIINLKELLNGAFTMFQLNSILQDRLQRIIV